MENYLTMPAPTMDTESAEIVEKREELESYVEVSLHIWNRNLNRLQTAITGYDLTDEEYEKLVSRIKHPVFNQGEYKCVLVYKTYCPCYIANSSADAAENEEDEGIEPDIKYVLDTNLDPVDIIIILYFKHSDHKFSGVRTFNLDGSMFQHYHGRDTINRFDCIGTNRLPKLLELQTDDIDLLLSSLDIIDIGSVVYSDPEGYPRTRELVFGDIHEQPMDADDIQDDIDRAEARRAEEETRALEAANRHERLEREQEERRRIPYEGATVAGNIDVTVPSLAANTESWYTDIPAVPDNFVSDDNELTEQTRNVVSAEALAEVEVLRHDRLEREQEEREVEQEEQEEEMRASEEVTEAEESIMPITATGVNGNLIITTDGGIYNRHANRIDLPIVESPLDSQIIVNDLELTVDTNIGPVNLTGGSTPERS